MSNENILLEEEKQKLENELEKLRTIESKLEKEREEKNVNRSKF